MSKDKRPDLKTNLYLTPEADELLRLAKQATGASFKFLVAEAIRTKYAKFAPKAADKQAA